MSASRPPTSPHRATAIGLALAALGACMLGLGWRGAAATAAVPIQVGYLLSGGAAGLCVAGTGLVVAAVQVLRVAAARRTRALAGLAAETAALVEALRARTAAGDARDTGARR